MATRTYISIITLNVNELNAPTKDTDWLKLKVSQLCPTLCDSMDYTAHGILQARIPEWVALPFSRGSSQPRDGTWVSRIVDRCFTIGTYISVITLNVNGSNAPIKRNRLAE